MSAKTAEPIDMLFGLWAWLRPRNRARWGPDPPWAGDNFGERGAHCKL